MLSQPISAGHNSCIRTFGARNWSGSNKAAIALNTLLFVWFPLVSGTSTLKGNVSSSAFHRTPNVLWARRSSSWIWRLANLSTYGTSFNTDGSDNHFLRLKPALRKTTDGSLCRTWASWVIIIIIIYQIYIAHVSMELCSHAHYNNELNTTHI